MGVKPVEIRQEQGTRKVKGWWVRLNTMIFYPHNISSSPLLSVSLVWLFPLSIQCILYANYVFRKVFLPNRLLLFVVMFRLMLCHPFALIPVAAGNFDPSYFLPQFLGGILMENFTDERERMIAVRKIRRKEKSVTRVIFIWWLKLILLNNNRRWLWFLSCRLLPQSPVVRLKVSLSECFFMFSLVCYFVLAARDNYSSVLRFMALRVTFVSR